MELSLCMIVKNEEERLEQCLQSVRDAVDEIVILDTGSADRTKEIALGYTEHVYDHLWQDDFAGARNASFALATKPFVMWLDADDVIDPPELEKLIALKEHLGDHIDAVMMPYQYAFSDNGTPTLVFDRERIVRRAAGFAFSGVVHEAMAVSGSVIHADIAVRHTGRHAESSNRRNLAIYESWIARGMRMAPRDQYYYARELKSAGEHERASQAFDVFLAMDGWAVNRQDALIERGECLANLGRLAEAKRSYFAALEDGEPRAETLCALGACFLQEGELRAAAMWYRAALLCRMPQERRMFTFPDAYGYVPLMQLCVILSRLGEEEEACRMNEQALLLRPGDPAALGNRAYFTQRLKKDRQDMEKTGWEE
ncbi:MAG: glycosyltransferase family 2 protein [Clostridia bacterium]|nr:glycosyltransferase family 2 protein [Clostridia bacterium]